MTFQLDDTRSRTTELPRVERDVTARASEAMKAIMAVLEVDRVLLRKQLSLKLGSFLASEPKVTAPVSGLA